MHEDYKKLLEQSVSALQGYSKLSVPMSLDGYLSTFFEDFPADKETQVFIMQTLAGCMHYKDLLAVVTSSFLKTRGKLICQGDAHIFTILQYICLIRLTEVGLTEFKKLLLSTRLDNTYQFFNFLLNDRNLKTWIKDEWMKILDEPILREKVLEPLNKHLPELRQIMSDLEEKLKSTQFSQPRLEKKQTVKSEPFDLHAPEPKKLLLPDSSQRKPVVTGTVVPETTYRDPPEFKKISKTKVSNRKRCEELLLEANKKVFQCAQPTSTLPARQRHDIEDPHASRVKSVPARTIAPVEEPVVVKMNTAAILREANLLKQKDAQVINRINELEHGKFDDIAFNTWKEENRHRDLEDQLTALAIKQMEGKLSYEQAILQKRTLVEENKQLVKKIKSQTASMMKDLEERKKEEDDKIKSLIEKTQQTRVSSKEAKQKTREQKAKIAKEISEENKRLQELAIAVAEEELRHKMRLIHEIRALESVPADKEKTVELSTTPGYGFLTEMSITELKERLYWLKTQQEAEEARKREEILNNRQAKHRMVEENLELIQARRTASGEATTKRLQEKSGSTAQSSQSAVMAVRQKPEVQMLEQRVLEHRAERERLKQLEREARNTSRQAKQQQRLLSSAKDIKSQRKNLPVTSSAFSAKNQLVSS